MNAGKDFLETVYVCSYLIPIHNIIGKLYAEEDESNDATVFLETSNGYYLNYLSKKYAHFGWYVGLTKEGRAKSGRKTWYPWGQKAIQFVPRKAYDEPHPLR